MAFVHDKATERLAQLPEEVILEEIEDFASRDVDLVCEFAHPNVTRQYGEMFLREVDYMPLSATVFADAAIEEGLKKTSLDHGTRLYIAHGGVVGLDAIIEGRDGWEEVTFVMKKNPQNVDFAMSGVDVSQIAPTGETVIYDGPTRGICPKFPRNVNTHATTALAGIGFDRTHSVLIVDPALDCSIVDIHCRGNGIDLSLRRADPIKGVTGAATLISVFSSVCKTAQGGPGIQFC